jgi:hypothetical protein
MTIDQLVQLRSKLQNAACTVRPRRAPVAACANQDRQTQSAASAGPSSGRSWQGRVPTPSRWQIVSTAATSARGADNHSTFPLSSLDFGAGGCSGTGWQQPLHLVVQQQHLGLEEGAAFDSQVCASLQGAAMMAEATSARMVTEVTIVQSVGGMRPGFIEISRCLHSPLVRLQCQG